MPLRRRPAEPSARVRALLEGAEVGARASGGGVERAPVASRSPTSTGPAPTGPAPTGHSRTGHSPTAADAPWLPQRSWIEGGAPHVPFAPPTPSVPERPGRHRRPMPPGPRLLTLPAALRGARWSGPRAAAVGLLLVLALAAVGFGARVAWARASSAPQVVAPTHPGSALSARAAGSTGFVSATTSAGAGGPPAVTTITVHVVGQVKAPGVFRLPAGSRVEDALERAGGVRPPADPSAINLARPLVDGEQVKVPRPGEAVSAAPTAGGPAPAAGATTGAGALLNLNTATTTQLEDLPGVGPVLAQRIVDWRTEHGRFTSVEELGEVSGIGEKMFAQLQPKVTV